MDSGWCGKHLRYTRVERLALGSNSVTTYRKTRTLWGSLGALVMNGAMRLDGSGVRVLSAAEWIRRERRLFEALGGSGLTWGPRWVALPEAPGQELDDWLRTTRQTGRAERSLRVIAVAASALQQFHQLSGESHGDATAENVLLQDEPGQARWIDFDVVHVGRLSWDQRRAEDFRALAQSVAAAAPGVAADAIIEAVGCGVDSDLVEEWATSLERSARMPKAFHQAQARLSRERLAGLADAARCVADDKKPDSQ